MKLPVSKQAKLSNLFSEVEIASATRRFIHDYSNYAVICAPL